MLGSQENDHQVCRLYTASSTRGSCLRIGSLRIINTACPLSSADYIRVVCNPIELQSHSYGVKLL